MPAYRLTARLLAGAAATALFAFSADAAELQLKRVMLSSGGVGYFEYQAEVTDTETLDVPVRLDQVDDVLKSAIIFDDAGGTGAIQLQGKDSLNEIFRTMPIGPEAFASPAALYGALQGEEVSVSEPVDVTGKIVSVVEETANGADGNPTVLRHRMSILTEDGLVQFVLEDARDIQFTNEALNQKVQSALAAVASNRQRELRTLKITARGEGTRTLTVGFVMEAPLWKTSYRLVMGNDGKARMQGWAVIENASGADWTNVELTLVSGNPVTFKQALYDKYYVDRQSVPVEVLGRVTPRRDEGAIAGQPSTTTEEGEMDGQGSPIEPAPAPAPMEPAGPAPAQAEKVTVTAVRKEIPDKPGQVAAESTEATTSVIFTMSNAVTAGSGQSLTVPILDKAIPAQMISYYQPETLADHPLSALKLVNDTGTGLPPGITTLFDNTSGKTIYAGDAVLSVLPTGDNRILSYAVDQKVTIDKSDDTVQTLTGAKISKGVLTTNYVERLTTTYVVKGAANEDRTVLIETPRYDWDLKSHDPSTVEFAGRWVRIPMAVGAGKTEKMAVVWEHTKASTAQVLDLSSASIAYYASADGNLPEPVRLAFARMAELKAAVDQVDTQIAANEAERQKIIADQDRIRSNLESVPDGDLKTRYLKTLSSQEDRLAQLDQSDAQLNGQKMAAEKALSDYVAGLTL